MCSKVIYRHGIDLYIIIFNVCALCKNGHAIHEYESTTAEILNKCNELKCSDVIIDTNTSFWAN